MRTRRTLGVLGGMGPAATLDFLARLQRRTPRGARDQDHLRVLVDINPQVPDRNLALAGEGPSPGPVLAAMARGLEGAGAEGLVIACNSAHAFAADIRSAVSIPLISIIDATVAAVLAAGPGVRRVGLLAADACLRARLYQDGCAAKGLAAITPDAADQAQLMEVIYRVKAGQTGPDDCQTVTGVAGGLVSRGAELIVSACTEVPLVLPASATPWPFVDSTEALVDAAVRFATGEAGKHPAPGP